MGNYFDREVCVKDDRFPKGYYRLRASTEKALEKKLRQLKVKTDQLIHPRDIDTLEVNAPDPCHAELDSASPALF